jgi:hypothetical protein
LTSVQYDAMLRELEAEEKSLFGERRALRLIKDEEQKKTHPPYVWNEDTNTPLFWKPGQKLIEGPKDEAGPEATPVAYFKRASLDKQLIRVTTATVQTPPAAPKHASAFVRRKVEFSPPPKYTLQPPTAPTSPFARDLPQFQPLPAGQAVPYFSQKYSSQTYTPAWSAPPVDYFSFQTAHDEERHKMLVQQEREQAARDLEKQKRKVERTVQGELESRRRLVEQEREQAARQAEKLRAREEREMSKASKKVRWGATDNTRIEPMNPAYHMVETGPYRSEWFTEPETTSIRHKVLKKRRMFT